MITRIDDDHSVDNSKIPTHPTLPRRRHGAGAFNRWRFMIWAIGIPRKATEAVAVFRKLLRLNPHGSQGVRFSLGALEAGKT